MHSISVRRATCTGRDPRRGVILLTTLTLVLLIAIVVALAQARALAGRAVFARLEREQRDALALLAAESRLRTVVAEALTGNPRALPLDGSPFLLEGLAPAIEVRLNDVGGLVDLYFAPDALLTALPGGPILAAGRATRTRDDIGRLPVEEATLAAFGVDAQGRRSVRQLVTQSGMPGGVTGATAPPAVKVTADGLGLAEDRPIAALRVTLGVKR